jgi:virginiamycin A acetyltransferase
VKKLIKRSCETVLKILVIPLYVVSKIQLMTTKKEHAFKALSHFLSLIPGLTGNYFRRAFYNLILQRCYRDCSICFGTIITHPTAEIGKNVFVGTNCTIGTTTIGNYVRIGSNVDIISGRQQHSYDEKGHIQYAKKDSFRRVHIGENSWIGNSAVIMANVGKECIIGAGSVVVKDIDNYSTAVGNPARIVKIRTPVNE